MANIVKKISAPYVIASATPGGAAVIDLGDAVSKNAEVSINGNLVVTGTQTVFTAVNLAVGNHEIVLNAYTPAIPGSIIDANTDPGFGNAFIVIDRQIYNTANVSIMWNQPLGQWMLTNDGVTYDKIVTSNNGYLTAIVEDTNPVLGANLHTNSFSITSNSNVVISPTLNTQIDSVIQLKELSVAPTANIAGYNTVYAATPDAGGSGVFVLNESSKNEELVTKRKAIVYSLIF